MGTVSGQPFGVPPFLGGGSAGAFLLGSADAAGENSDSDAISGLDASDDDGSGRSDPLGLAGGDAPPPPLASSAQAEAPTSLPRISRTQKCFWLWLSF